MKIIFNLILLTFLISNCSENSVNTDKNSNNGQAEINELKYEIIKPTAVSKKNYHEELKYYSKDRKSSLPIKQLPFYRNLKTPFKVYGKSIIDTLGETTLVGNHFRYDDNIPLFTILVKTKIIDDNSKASINGENYPYIYCQGTIMHEVGEINWTLIQKDTEYGNVLISGKIFDLSNGRTILIYDNDNKGIEFAQINDIFESRNEKSKEQFYTRIAKSIELDSILNSN